MKPELKMLLTIGLAAGASYFGAQQIAKLQWMQDHPNMWYLPPAALVVVAILVAKKNKMAAVAVMASAVVVGIVEYRSFGGAAPNAPAPPGAPVQGAPGMGAPKAPPALPAGGGGGGGLDPGVAQQMADAQAQIQDLQNQVRDAEAKAAQQQANQANPAPVNPDADPGIIPILDEIGNLFPAGFIQRDPGEAGFIAAARRAVRR